MTSDLQVYGMCLSLSPGPRGSAGRGQAIKGVVLVLLPGIGPHAVGRGRGRSLPV